MTPAGPPLRAVALDLDGTLLDPALQIHPDNLRALDGLRRRGIPVFLVTGRHHIATHVYHHQLALSTPAVCCNGLYLHDFAQGLPLHGDPLPTPRRLALLQQARRHGLHVLAYLGDRFCFERREPVLDHVMAWAARQPAALRPRFEQVVDLEPVLAQAPCMWKAALSHDDPARLAAAAEDLAGRWHLGVVQTGPRRLDVGMPGHDKATGLASAVAGHGLRLSEVLAFGDQHNDIPMLGRAGHGVAMAGAPAPVVEAADEQAGSHAGPAIAAVIGRLVREGRLA